MSLVNLLSSQDVETARYASLCIGNMVLEEQGRRAVLQTPCISHFASLLSSADKQTVRYACGAVRNIAVEESGRRVSVESLEFIRVTNCRVSQAQAVLAVPAVVAVLQELTNSADAATSRYVFPHVAAHLTKCRLARR
jgi:hypothetical protein